MSTIHDAVKTSIVLEAAENYTKADDPLATIFSPDINEYIENPDNVGFMNEEEFWKAVTYNQENFQDKKITFYNGVVVSEWIARIPGLYWKPESKNFRKIRPEEIERLSARWTRFTTLRQIEKGNGWDRYAAFSTGYAGESPCDLHGLSKRFCRYSCTYHLRSLGLPAAEGQY